MGVEFPVMHQLRLILVLAAMRGHRVLLVTPVLLATPGTQEQHQPFFVSHLPGAMEARVGTPEQQVMEARVGVVVGVDLELRVQEDRVVVELEAQDRPLFN